MTASLARQAREAHAPLELVRQGLLEQAIARHVAAIDRYPTNVLGAPVWSQGGARVRRWRGEHVDRLLVVWPFGPKLEGTGHGDWILFARYLPAARRRCNRMIVVAPPALQSIALRCAGADESCGHGALAGALRRADAYIPMWFELPAAAGQTYGEPLPIAPPAPSADTLPRNVRNVGLCWRASPRFGARRSIALTSAIDVLQDEPRARFHCLQIEPAGARPWMVSHQLDADWERTAELVARLDAVVTVDTAIAHVAGSLGIPTDLVLTSHEDWRWGLGDRTPWYPSMRVHRAGAAAAARFAQLAAQAGASPC